MSSPYGNRTGPNSGVFTGTAIPTNSVSVLVARFVTHTFPLASIANPNDSVIPESAPHPALGESTAPGVAAAAPASSVSPGTR